MATFLAFQQQVRTQAQLSRQRAIDLISGGEGITTLAAMDRIAGEMQDEENRLLSSRSAQSQQSVQRSYATFFVAADLTLVAVVWLSIGTLRNLLERQNDAVRILQLVYSCLLPCSLQFRILPRWRLSPSRVPRHELRIGPAPSQRGNGRACRAVGLCPRARRSAELQVKKWSGGIRVGAELRGAPFGGLGLRHRLGRAAPHAQIMGAAITPALINNFMGSPRQSSFLLALSKLSVDHDKASKKLD